MRKALIWEARNQKGFTLVELMVTVVIVAVLALIAFPAYTQYTVKAKRSAAESFIMSIANKQEQFILDSRSYATSLATLQMSAPADVASNYSISISVSSPPPGYTITATPTGTQLANDTKCGSLSLNQAGTQSIGGTGTVSECW